MESCQCIREKIISFISGLSFILPLRLIASSIYLKYVKFCLTNTDEIKLYRCIQLLFNEILLIKQISYERNFIL